MPVFSERKTFEWQPDYAAASLAYLIQDKDFIRCYHKFLKPAYYKSVVHQVICRAILSWWSKYKTLPNHLTMQESIGRLKETGKVQELNDPEFYDVVSRQAAVLVGVNTVGQGEHFRDSFVRFIERRSIEMATLKIATELVPNGASVEEVKKVMRDALEVGLISAARPSFLGDEEAIAERDKWRSELPQTKVPTGLYTLDNRMGGGLGQGELGVILAGPSRGKTSTLVQLSANAIRFGHKNPLYVSREQDKFKIGTKLDCYLSELRRADLESKPKTLRKAWAKLLDNQHRLAFKKFNRACTTDEVFSEIRLLEVRDGFKTDILIVDYADKMSPNVPIKDGGWEAIGQVYQDLFDMAQELNIPIWTASQTKRDALNKAEVDMDSLGECYKKAHIADVIVAICQTQAQFEEGKLEGNSPKANLFIAKNRDNEARVKIPIVLDYYTSTWKEQEGGTPE